MDIKERMQTTIVLVTHDAAVAIVLQPGQTIVDGYTKGSMAAWKNLIQADSIIYF